MARKSEKTLYDFKMNIWQATNNEIRMKIFNPFGSGKKEHLSCVFHTDQYHGNNMARTHNDLFKMFKEVLEGEGKWKNIIPKLGKKKKIVRNEEANIDNEYGFIYVTTNLANGKKYIGKHTVFGDDYLGSGTILKKAIEKYGKENFVRKDIAFAYDHEQLCDLEKYYIDKFKAVKDPNFYNCLFGGDEGYEKEVQLIVSFSDEA